MLITFEIRMTPHHPHPHFYCFVADFYSSRASSDVAPALVPDYEYYYGAYQCAEWMMVPVPVPVHCHRCFQTEPKLCAVSSDMIPCHRCARM